MTKLPLIAAAAAVCAAGSLAAADQIEIEFFGLDLAFSDRAGSLTLRTEQADGTVGRDTLDAAAFYVDGQLVGVQSGGLNQGGLAGVSISGFNDLDADGGSDTNDFGAGYFTIDFTPNNSTDGLIDLNVDSGDATLFFEDRTVTFLLSGEGLIKDGTVQSLPFGIGQLDPHDEVIFTWSASDVDNLVVSGGEVVAFDAQGSGTLISDRNPVPEPTAALGLAGLAGLSLMRRRA